MGRTTGLFTKALAITWSPFLGKVSTQRGAWPYFQSFYRPSMSMIMEDFGEAQKR